MASASATEKMEQWSASVDRMKLASAALLASIKLFDAGGPDAQQAWNAVEANRAALVAAQKREGARWKAITNLEDEPQQEIPGTEAPGPKGKGGGGAQSGPKLLPGKREKASGED